MYETQLNAYARIGEERGLAPVSDLALVYTEPMTDDDAASDDDNHNGEGFALGFSVRVVPVPLNAAMLGPLMARTRELYQLEECPTGRGGCKDCQQLGSLLELATG